MPLGKANSFTHREAAQACGVSVDTIKRRQKDGSFPGAEQVDRMWRIPSAELAKVAADSGWSLVLPGAEPKQTPKQSARAAHAAAEASAWADIARLEAELAAERQSAADRVEAQESLHTLELAGAEKDLKRTTAERDQARSDVEQYRTQVEQLRMQVSELETANAVAEALATERAEQLEKAENQIQVHMQEKADALARADAATDAHGWFSRRKFRKALELRDGRP